MEWLFKDGALQGAAAPPVPVVTRILAADLGAHPCHGYAEFDPETVTVAYSAAPPLPSCWGYRVQRCMALLPGWQGPGWYACYRRDTRRYFRLHAVKADPFISASPQGPSTVSKEGT